MKFIPLIVSVLLLNSCLMLKQDSTDQAVAEIYNLDTKKKMGIASFERTASGDIKISLDIKGLSGVHAMHIHQYGDLRENGKFLGGHFNPFNVKHGHPNEGYYAHTGDLGNITADNNGRVKTEIVDTKISLRSRNSIIGRSIVIHARQDDFTTQPSGNAGKMIAAGVIGYAKP